MMQTPKSLRLQIGIFGRTNVGKSSFLNMVSAQDVSITSHIPGTTTDVVEKTMELLPVGPVVFLDTAGVDDVSELSSFRINKTRKIVDRADVILLVVESDVWTKYEGEIVKEAETKKIPVIIVVNKSDKKYPGTHFLSELKQYSDKILVCSSVDITKRDHYVNILKGFILSVCPDDFISPPTLVGDLLGKQKLAVLIVPIDMEAPKGRIILPQVHTIRDILDNDAAVMVVKEKQYRRHLDTFSVKPDIVICDSQVVHSMVKDTPKDIKCTTFSIVFSRYKGDLVENVRAVSVVNKLKPNDKILIAEACSHHAIEDDIGRIKIPNWLKKHVGGDLDVDVCSGRDYPDDLSKYKLVIQCGGCMITRKEMLVRINRAKIQQVPITNYGVLISYLQGVLKRVLEPFEDAYLVYKDIEKGKIKK